MKTWAAADSRAEQSVERLETRLYLSQLASYSMASSDWFGVVDSSFSSSGGLSGSSSGEWTNSAASARQFLVRLTPEATAQAGSLAGVQNLISDNDVELVVTGGLGLPGQVIVSTTERDSVQVVQSLSSNDAVAHFEEDFSVGATTRFPNEDGNSAEFSRQFGLNNTGQTGGVANVDIDAPEAWDISIGSSQVVASVIDSGVDFTHRDLYLNIWLNQGELPPQFVDPDATTALSDIDSDGLITFRDLNDAANSSFVTDLNGNGYIDAGDLLEDPKWADGIDTDDNGFEDDLVGWDFFENDNKPFDEHRHGTHVAGILGAVGDNGLGVSGVNWQTSIMPLRFLDEDNRGDVSSAVEAINYTTMMRTRAGNPVNVRVSNNSWGASGAFSQSLFDAVAGNAQADILFVAAAGNGDVLGQGVNNNDVAFFPANLELENVISVAALNDRGELASFSNFGTTTVDIAAPGVGIVSTDAGGGFISRSGTSMATPFVAGVGALVFDVFPEATAAEVRDAILSGAVVSGSLDGFIEGSRSLNAFGALTASTFAPVPELVPVAAITADGTASLDITVTYTDDGSVDTSSFDIRDVEITRQGFSETLLTPASVATTTVNVDGQDRDAAVYTFTAPGGTFDATENGAWFVSLREGEIQDNLGLYSAPRELGQFTVSIDAGNVFFVNTTLDTIDADLGDGVAEDSAGRTSLRAAIMHANQAGTATTIVVPDGVYALTIPGQNENVSATGDLDLTSTQGITIVGGGGLATTIDAQQLDRVFDIAAGATATIKGLGIRNGNADQGGGIRNSGTLTLNESLVTTNSADTAGGGIMSSGTVTIAGSSIEKNVVTSRLFATGGGGIAVTGDPATSAGRTSISGSSIVNNISAAAGGGIIADDAELTLTNMTIAANTAQRSDGGGVQFRATGNSKPSTLSSVTITDNTAIIGSGGGLSSNIATAQITVSSSIIAQNTARTSADVEALIISDGTNLFGQPSETQSNWRTLAANAADFDQIGTVQSPLDPQLQPLERSTGLVQAREPITGGRSSNDDLAGIAEPALTPGLPIVYSTVELEPNNSRGEAMRLDDRGWSLDADPDIANSTTIPHVTITGTGDGTFDYFSFTVSEPNSTAVFDIDNGSLAAGETFNTKLFLFDSSDTLLDSNETASIDAGSTSDQDARIEHTFSTPGYYTLAIGTFDSSHSGSGQLTGTAPAVDTRYVLNIALTGHSLAETTYTPTASNTLVPVAGTATDETYLFSAREGLSLFSSPTTFSTAQSPDAVTLDDFNGDGIADIVTANRHSDSVSVLRGNGDGTFQPAVDFAVGANPQSIHTGDVDNDGNQDIVTGNKDDGTVSVLRGNGDGTFATAEHFPVGSIPQSVVLTDVSGDGILDLVSDGVDVSVLQGNGDGTFQTPQVFDVASGINAVAVGDIDGDGFEDIVTAHAIRDQVNVLKGNGDATFQSAQVFSVGDGPRSVVVDDINGDGIGDIITGNYLGHDVSILQSNGDGSFQPSQSFSVGPSVDAVAIADVNGDRIVDIITANRTLSNDGVSILGGNGDGSFQAAQSLAVRDSSALTLGDVDGDGTVDIVTANSAFDEISVLAGRGSRLLELSGNHLVSLPVREIPIAFATQQDTQYWLASTAEYAKFVLWSFSRENGVGVTRDIAWTGEMGRTPGISILDDTLVVRDDSTSHEIVPVTAQETVTQIADGTFENAVTLAIGSVPHSVVLVDVNGDGILDVVSDGIDVVVLQGNEDGTFQAPQVFDVASGIDAVTVGDIDGDGIDDAVTAHGTRDEVNILKGNGDGTFQEAVVLPVGDAPFSLAVRDVNDDSFGDIITGNVFGDDVSVLLSNGDGSFQAAQSLDIGRSVIAVAVDDVDGDGHLDVVTANGTFSNDGVSILRGNGDGSFQAAQSLAVRDSSALALGDVDGDGTVDIVTASPAFDEISVLRGNGGGTFQASRSYPVGDNPRAVILGDVDGDAVVDIIAVNKSSDDVTVLAGNGDGTFRFANTFPVGDDPVAAGLGDINRDGLLDIVTANSGSDDISILKGRSSIANVLRLNNATVFGGRTNIQVRPGNGSQRIRLPLTSVASTFGSLTQSRDYDFVDLAVFRGQLLALVRLTGTAGRPGELQLLLIDAPEFDADTGRLLLSDVENLTLNSNLRLTASDNAQLFVAGDRIYLTAGVVGSGLGEELLVFDRTNGVRLVGDLVPGSQSSQPRDFAAAGDDVYFTALASRVDNSTQQPVLRRELFFMDADGNVEIVRSGQASFFGPSVAGDSIFFASEVNAGEPAQLFRFDPSVGGAAPIGAFEATTGDVAGTVFLDRNSDGQQNAGEPGRAGITLFVDLNDNGRREASEPATLTRFDDPATAVDETGRFEFTGLAAGTVRIREVPVTGFTQTTPLAVQSEAPQLTLLRSVTPGAGNPGLGLASIIGDSVVFVDQTDAPDSQLVVNGESVDLTIPDEDVAIQSLGAVHAQDGSSVVFTAILADGRELVLERDSRGDIQVVVDTGQAITSQPLDGQSSSTVLTDIKNDLNGGFDTLSLSGGSVGLLAQSDDGNTQYYLGGISDGRFAEFASGQATFEGDNEIFIDRIVEDTGAVLTGSNLFLDKATLDAQVGGNTGWRITTRSGDEILPLTFFDRIFDVSVSGQSALFRASSVSGDESIFLASVDGGLTRLIEASTPVPDAAVTFTAIGSAAENPTLPSVTLDGGNMVFVGGGDFAPGNIAFSVAVGDVTGDGLADIVAANQLTDDVSVLRGAGDGAFQPAQNFAVGLGPFAVTLGDVTGDGILDIVTANGFSSDVSVLVADGTDGFLASQEFAVGDFPETLALGDVNGDGILDIVTGNSGSFDVSVLVGNDDGTGNGDGTFQTAQEFVLTDAPDSISLGDVTGDGVIDIVTSNESGDANILQGNGDGTFQAAQSFAVGADAFVLSLGDVNGDGILDIVTANGSTDDVSVLVGNDDGTGNGDGTFQLTGNFAVGGDNPGSLSLHDVTGDEVPDVITANVDSDNVSLLVGNGDGTFRTAQTFSTGSFPFAISMGDITSDGNIDIVTTNPVSENMSVLTGNGNGDFNRFPAQLGLYAQISGENSLRKIIDRTDFLNQTDFPGQTLTDIAISHDAINGDSIVFRASFSGGAEGIYLAELPAEPVANITVVAGQTTSGVLFGSRADAGVVRGTSFTDSDLDGLFDAGEAVNARRTVFLDANLNGQLDDSEIRTVTDADGAFVFSELPSETEYVVREVVPDGLAVTVPLTLAGATVRLGAASTVEVVLGSVDSGALGNSADGVVSGVVFNDLDEDGEQDPDTDAEGNLIEAGMGGITVFVDKNGDGILNGGERSSTTTADGSYVIDQLRGTKQAVRVVLPGETTAQSTPLGNSFTTSNLRTVDSPVEVVTGDFNGDGVDDVATTINQASEVRLFLNNGSGEFIAGDSVEVSGGPGSIAVGRFQGPTGRDGLVVGHRTTSSVKLLLPQPNNSFDSVDLIRPQDILSGGQFEGIGFGPFMVTTGDFNADGNDDIAVASQSALPAGGAVAVFLSDGDGTFTHEQTLTLPRADADFPTAITAGLVNPGGTVDLVLSNLTTANVTILSNSGVAGSSRFSIDRHLPVLGRAPSSVQLGDLDGDGDNEIVTTNLLSNNVSIFDNNGDGTFSTASVLTAGQGPAFAKLVDLDQNDSLDIAFSNSEAGNRFGILRNRGDGRFLAAETSGLALLSDGTLAFSLAVGSFDDDNGDGVIDNLDTPDIVVSNRSGESLNTGAGSLTVGVNSIVPGALTVELPTDTRSASGLNFGLRTINLPPTITTPDDPNPVDEDAGEQTVVLTGITTGGETETLQVTVSSNNPELINPEPVNFNAGAGTATVHYTPAADQSGTAQITVTVRDAGIDGSFDAADPESDDGVATASFNVVVNPVNDLPPAEADTFGVLLEDGATVLNVLANDDLANPDTGELLTILFARQPASGSVAIVNGGTQLQYTPAAGFIGRETFNYIVSDNQFTAQGTVTVNVTSNVTPSDLLTVSSITPNPSGFDVVFSDAFNSSLLNLYATQSLGPADVVVTGTSTGIVRGSLIVDGAGGTASFIRTGGPLPADTYTVTLRSGDDGFVTTDGDLLDGDSNRTGGDDFATTFTMAPLSPETVTVSIPDFARGFGQEVNVPADGTGIPLTLSRGTGISGLNLDVSYDSNLLDITGFVPTVAGLLTDFNAETGALAVSRPTEFTSDTGPLTIGYFTANVPADALYTSKHLIEMTSLQVFDDSVDTALVPSVADSAIHVAAFPGDANASRSYNSPDTTLTLRQATDRIDGLSLYPLADPALISDVTFDTSILANDATVVQRLITNVDVPAVPDLPSGVDPLPARGPDPILSIPRNLSGRLGQTVSVPVQVEVTEAAGITISGLDVAISYDASQFSVSNVRAGTLLTDNDLSPFSVFANTSTPGQLLVTASSAVGTSQLAQNTMGDVFLIDFTVLGTAAGGASAINLRANSGGLITGIADNGLSDLMLAPAPTNSTGDSVDGLFTVTTDVTLVERSPAGELIVRDNSTAGQNNQITLTLDGQTLVITESVLPVVAAFGQQISDQEVRVALADVSASIINVMLEAGDDRVDGSALTAGVSLKLLGSTGNDMLTGGAGNDTLSGGLGDDDLDGGSGTDTLVIMQDGHLSITATQTFGQGTDSFTNIEQAVLEGGSGNNRLDASGTTIPVTLLGHGGSDTLLGGGGVDRLDGGAGADYAEIVGSNIILTDGSAPGSGGEVLIGVEGLQLIASVAGSTIDASGYTQGSVTIVGSNGDDFLTGGSGNDLILAGAGRDSVSGGGGNDFILGGRGHDTIHGDAGNDTLIGGGGHDTIRGGSGSDFAIGGGGHDVIEGDDDPDRLFGGSGDDTIRSGSGNDVAIGGGGRDLIDGDEGDDTLFGRAGFDDIAGGLGSDRLNGVDRDNSFVQTTGQDTLFGGERSAARGVAVREPETPAFTPAEPSEVNSGTAIEASGFETSGTSGIDTAFADPLLPQLLQL